MDEKIYIENLKYLKEINHLTNQKFANLLQIDISTFKSILRGERNLVRANQLLICDIFMISLDQLMKHNLREDMICANINYNDNDISVNSFVDEFRAKKSMTKFFIIFEDKNIKDEKYLDTLSKFKNLLSMKIGTEITPAETINEFIDYYMESKNLNACANAVSSILVFWLFTVFYDVENFHDFLYLMKSIMTKKQQNGLSETQIDYLDEYYVQFIDLLAALQKSGKFNDFVSYSLCLKTCFNFVDRKLLDIEDSEARSIGLIMLAEIGLTGNKYAKGIKNIGDIL